MLTLDNQTCNFCSLTSTQHWFFVFQLPRTSIWKCPNWIWAQQSMEGKASFPLKSIGHSVGRYYIVYTVTGFFAYSGDLQLLLKPPSQNIMTVSIDSGRSKYNEPFSISSSRSGRHHINMVWSDKVRWCIRPNRWLVWQSKTAPEMTKGTPPTCHPTPGNKALLGGLLKNNDG